MSHIIIIDDDPSVLTIFKKALSPSIEIDFCEDLESAHKKIHTSSYDMILLDLYFPDGKSIDFLMQLKVERPEILKKIIMMTATGSLDDEVELHQLGVLDYLKKPFNLKLLRAVVDKHLMNIQGTQSSTRESGHFLIDLNNHTISIKINEFEKQTLELTLKEFKMLKYLIENANRVISREQIMGKVWDISSDTLTRTVDMHISTIRKKIAPYSKDLKTVRGMGYSLEIK